MATETELKDQLERVNNYLKVATEEKQELEEKLGMKSGRDVSEKHKQEDESTTLFNKMSSAELMELYQTDRGKWQEIVDGVLSAGERKLAALQQQSRPW